MFVRLLVGRDFENVTESLVTKARAKELYRKPKVPPRSRSFALGWPWDLELVRKMPVDSMLEEIDEFQNKWFFLPCSSHHFCNISQSL